ncbi:hypothetical protein TNCV_3828321 [Trichonephila clavipes]|nr:hypothetical protein TNCV_3828321 [Trichonephila clavipes]
MGGRLNLNRCNVHRPPLHDGSSELFWPKERETLQRLSLLQIVLSHQVVSSDDRFHHHRHHTGYYGMKTSSHYRSLCNATSLCVSSPPLNLRQRCARLRWTSEHVSWITESIGFCTSYRRVHVHTGELIRASVDLKGAQCT